MTNIKLEVGGRYLNKEGEVVVVEKRDGASIPFYCSDGFWRDKDGTTPGNNCHIFDLIEEIKEDEA